MAERGGLDKRQLVWRGFLGVDLAVGANIVVALAARAVLPIPDDFFQLTLPPVIVLTAIGGLLAMLAYKIVQKRSATPAATFRKVAVVALVVSWGPDIALGLSGQPGVTWLGVSVLMLLHVVAAGVMVAALTHEWNWPAPPP